MILVRQRSTWERGERSLVPFDAVYLKLPEDERDNPVLHPIIEAMHDVRLHTGLPAARLEMTRNEWESIRDSASFRSAVKYCGPATATAPDGTQPTVPNPEMLAAMLGVAVVVLGAPI